MANHKRRKPKHQRAGCLMCKPHKDERGKNGKKAENRQARRLREDPVPKLVNVEVDRMLDENDDDEEGSF